jgi:hypothetical protein
MNTKVRSNASPTFYSPGLSLPTRYLATISILQAQGVATLRRDQARRAHSPIFQPFEQFLLRATKENATAAMVLVNQSLA